MIKHLEDGADCTMLVSTSGALLVVCTLCKKLWTGTFTPAEFPTTVETAGVKQNLKTAVRTNPSALEDVGIDPDDIGFLLG
jgi:hypothetical protein